MDPIKQRLNARDEARFASEFLDSDQRRKLLIAQDYARQLEIRLTDWWKKARPLQRVRDAQKAGRERKRR